jgi:hypothetical protein
MLRGATNHHAKESLHYGLARVTPPPKGPPRDRCSRAAKPAHIHGTHVPGGGAVHSIDSGHSSGSLQCPLRANIRRDGLSVG